MKLFAPQDGGTTTQAATTSASTAKLLAGSREGAGGFQVRVYNDGTTLGYIEFGGSTVAATTSSIPIPPGIPCGFTIANAAAKGAPYFSVIMASGSATFSVTTGDGI